MKADICLKPKNKAAKGCSQRDDWKRLDAYFLELLDEYPLLPRPLEKILDNFDEQQANLSQLLEKGTEIIKRDFCWLEHFQALEGMKFHVGEASIFLYKGKLQLPGGSVPLLGNVYLSFSLDVFIIGPIEFWTVDEDHHVGILLDSS